MGNGPFERLRENKTGGKESWIDATLLSADIKVNLFVLSKLSSLALQSVEGSFRDIFFPVFCSKMQTNTTVEEDTT